ATMSTGTVPKARSTCACEPAGSSLSSNVSRRSGRSIVIGIPPSSGTETTIRFAPSGTKLTLLGGLPPAQEVDEFAWHDGEQTGFDFSVPAAITRPPATAIADARGSIAKSANVGSPF